MYGVFVNPNLQSARTVEQNAELQVRSITVVTTIEVTVLFERSIICNELTFFPVPVFAPH